MIHSLTHAQERILYGNDTSQLYTVTVPVTPKGHVSRADAHRALATLRDAHDALRSRLVRAADGTFRIDVAAPGAGHDRWDVVDHTDEPDGHENSEPRPLDPLHHAVRCDIRSRADRVESIVLTVSHLFADGYSTQVLHDDLHTLLRGGVLSGGASRKQSTAYLGDRRLDAVADENTAFWKQVLRDAPRACTYSGALRCVDEEFHVGRDLVDVELSHRVLATADACGVSPYVIWATALSLLVSRYTGQDRHVFRSITANRYETDDYQAVANLTLPVPVRVDGRADETLRERLRRAGTSISEAHRHGVFDTVALLRWLETDDVRAGAAFRPAFDINYLFHADELSPDGSPSPGEFRHRSRLVPERGSADLALHIFHGSRVWLRLTAARPLWRERPVMHVLADLTHIVTALCDDRTALVADLDIDPLPAQHRMIAGHRSGVRIDPDTMRAMLGQAPGVRATAITPRQDADGVTSIEATVAVDQPTGPDELRRQYSRLQQWTSGTVVPDVVICVPHEPSGRAR